MYKTVHKSTFLILFFVLYSIKIFGQKHYLFTYFTGNGEDGLHLAYSQDGLKWEALNNGKSILTPRLGKSKLMRDPCVIQGKNGEFILVWTTGWSDQIIGMATTKDFINWSKQEAIPVMKHEPEAKNAWAPEIIYDDQNEEYLILWASTILNRHGKLSESDNEKGWNHRMYATTTKDLKQFSESKLYFDPNFSVIDATLFKTKKEYVMILKNENPNPPQKNLRITTSTNLKEGFSAQVSEKITGDYWAEGPSALKIGKYYYVYFDKYIDKKYGCIRSKDLKKWEDISDKISFPDGTRHGTVIEVEENVIENLKKNFK